ncbi:MAG: hypothetical protein IPI66_02210 [Chitinophagaceae bacterium]|nr:hypothetical protein [Chitinophagaceae bacterium]MBL0054991.1 hypothetical protein [Chitinophagaceae bacterium]
MKKLTTIFTAVIMLLTTTAFAADGDNVTEEVKAAFRADFSGASQVSWEKISDFYFASFTLQNDKVDAAYNEKGELVGTSRRIGLAQLPLGLSMELNRKFEGYTFSAQAFELNYEGQTHYYLSAENSKQTLKLKGNANGEVEIESKSKK